MEHYEVIVLGLGGVGSAAVDRLAQRGAQVLGLDRFSPGHDRGSSHGQTRIIRRAYFEHPDYVPLLIEAYRLWRDLEARRGETLLEEVGLVQVGPPEGEVVAGVLHSAALHHLEIEQLSAAEVEYRFPGFRVPPGMVGVLEPRAGFLHVERAVIAQAIEAKRHGAVLRWGETVQSWEVRPRGTVVVTTDQGSYATERLIVAAGPWASELLGQLGAPLKVLRKSVFWLRPRTDTYLASSGSPTFLYDLPGGCFYGFPQIDARGVKVAEHSGGRPVDDPLAVDRRLDPNELVRVTDFCDQHVPQLTREVLEHAVCMYTMTPDGHFVVDRHPEHKQVVFAAGLSGHGFKFVPVLGQILSDLALDGRTESPIEFLSCGRAALGLQ